MWWGSCGFSAGSLRSTTPQHHILVLYTPAHDRAERLLIAVAQLRPALERRVDRIGLPLLEHPAVVVLEDFTPRVRRLPAHGEGLVIVDDDDEPSVLVGGSGHGPAAFRGQIDRIHAGGGHGGRRDRARGGRVLVEPRPVRGGHSHDGAVEAADRVGRRSEEIGLAGADRALVGVNRASDGDVERKLARIPLVRSEHDESVEDGRGRGAPVDVGADPLRLDAGERRAVVLDVERRLREVLAEPVTLPDIVARTPRIDGRVGDGLRTSGGRRGHFVRAPGGDAFDVTAVRQVQAVADFEGVARRPDVVDTCLDHLRFSVAVRPRPPRVQTRDEQEHEGETDPAEHVPLVDGRIGMIETDDEQDAGGQRQDGLENHPRRDRCGGQDDPESDPGQENDERSEKELRGAGNEVHETRPCVHDGTS